MSVLRKNAAAAALAVSLIGSFEGLRTHAYSDVVGVATICYGETKGVHLGDVSTKTECDDKFKVRLDEFADSVEKCLGDAVLLLPDKTEVAFVSLAYNIGQGAFCKSSVVTKFRAGDTRGACGAIMNFNRAGGHVLPALTNRRAKERALCLSGLQEAGL